MPMKQWLKCPSCGHSFESPFGPINATLHISLDNEWPCPKCGVTVPLPDTVVDGISGQETIVVRSKPGDAETWFERLDRLASAVKEARSIADIGAIEQQPEFEWAGPLFAAARKRWKDNDLRGWIAILLSLIALIRSCASSGDRSPTINVNVNQFFEASGSATTSAPVAPHDPKVQPRPQSKPPERDDPKSRTGKRRRR
jgi:hypothetical protein